MDKIQRFVEKYALFISIIGIVIIILMNLRINNLPNPFFLAPGELIRRYTVPLRLSRLTRATGVLITLVGFYFFVKNIFLLNSSESVDTDNITRAIAKSLSGAISSYPGTIFSKPGHEQNESATEHNQIRIENIAIPQQSFSPASISANHELSQKTEVVQVIRQMTEDGLDYVFIDENENNVIGIHDILNYFTKKGYSIVNTIYSKTNETEAIEIILNISS